MAVIGGHSARTDLYLHQQAIDTSTDASRALFQMLGVFAEFERSLIRARVQAGVDRVRTAGRCLGRPEIGNGKKRRPGLADQIRASLKAGTSIRVAAAEHKVEISTVQRIIREDRIRPAIRKSLKAGVSIRDAAETHGVSIRAVERVSIAATR